MVLTTRNLWNYLLSRGLVSYDSIVEGALIITDASHRNRSFRVRRGTHPSYFVKQIRDWDPISISGWDHENVCYRRLSTSNFMPKHYLSDHNSRIFVFELISESETLSEFHRRQAGSSPGVGFRQGAVLAELHRSTQGSETPGKVPWILSVQETNPAWFDSLSPANARLLEIVQGYPEYCELLNELRQEWDPSCLIHGDVKWDNILIRSAESVSPELYLVDWEMSIFGDPCWDIGAVFQAYINFWLYSMPFHETMNSDLLVIRAKRPLNQLQTAIREFWNGYTSEMKFDSCTSRMMLSRSIRCSAARMIQSAYEMMHMQQAMPPVGGAMLQTSFNILTRPADAIQSLLGLDYDSSAQ